MEKVIITEGYSIYDESGHCIEYGFLSYKEAYDYIIDNNMVLVDGFFI